MPAHRTSVKRSRPSAPSRTAIPSQPTSRGSWPTGNAIVVIVIAACIAYSNSLSAPFVFDDLDSIVGNSHTRRLWPLFEVLAGSPRPVVTFTLALNYALSGLAVWGYHAANLAIHILAALTLFAILRRTFAGPRLGARYSAAAAGLALAAAALWAVHPLNTEAVTYIVQRSESLAGLFYLLTLYATIRGAASERRAAVWYAAAAAACALGAATKPLLVSAPIVVLIYDRMFLAESWSAVFRRRGALYVALAATWGVIIGLAMAAPDTAAGFGLPTVSPLAYAATQPGVILHYLRLAVWPGPLVLDYGWPVAHSAAAILVPALAVAAIVVATVWAAARLRPIAFLGVWFVLVLGPSSSVFPINDLAVEHRMYLPLAAVVVLVVVGAYDMLVRRARAPVAARALAIVGVVVASVATIRRNQDYRSEIAMWSDVVAKRPLNGRGYNNLGRAFLRMNDVDRALPQLLEAVSVAPRYPLAHNNLGAAMALKGHLDEAIVHYRDALALTPNYPEAHYNLGLALARQSRFAEAIEQYQESLRLQPAYAEAWDAVGNAQAHAGRYDAAIRAYRAALRADPDFAQSHNNLGLALAATGQGEEAIASYRRAIHLAPQVTDYHVNLGAALTSRGLFDQALAEYQAALELAPDAPQIHNNIGIVLARQGRLDEAIARFREALRLRPDFLPARRNLGYTLVRQGRTAEAAPYLAAPSGP